MPDQAYVDGVDVCSDPNYDCREVYPIGENVPMSDGRFYESVYSVGGIRTVFPGWEQEAINSIRVNVESNPGCYVNYIYMEPNNQVVVQWSYNYAYYVAEMRAAGYDAVPVVVPLAAYAVAIGVLVVIGLYLLSQMMSTVKEILVDSKEQVDLITWAIIIIALCVLVFAIVYALRNITSMLPKNRNVQYIEGI